ncbi:protein FAM149B1-like [Actinia tenebrosa]|uniref:Protein FAM149B1-like n=1 Tax=Actinia tenebrosa TaxID=6105 RepID=A0A6P8IBT9_ACTTE|nr:protein FAM149B1-like [Actinia tenebrosa]
MMIKSLALQHRAPSAAAIHPIDSREGTPYIQGRPGSSSTVASRMSRFGRVPDNFLNRMASAKTRRNPASQRLAPLERERPKTPNTQEDVKCEIVRGTKLLPGGERLTSPPHPLNTSSPQPWGARNGTLPPLERTVSYGESTAAVSTLVSASTTGSSNQTLHSAARSSAKAKVHFNVRASSAATDDSRRSLRERAPVFSESRPNTTHSFRTDTPSANANNRRLSTPMNNFNHSRGVLGTNRQPLDLGGITGVSMSISAGPPGSDLHTSHSGHHGDSRGISPISDEADEVESYFGHAGHQRRGRLGTIR